MLDLTCIPVGYSYNVIMCRDELKRKKRVIDLASYHRYPIGVMIIVSIVLVL